MVQPGADGLDTPRTNIGDATYLNQQPDFDISQELSFQSPTKDGNLLTQLRNGGRPNLHTPRGNRNPLTDRRNLPAGLGGPEFTPLLKNATTNSARRFGNVGKENGRATPGFLARIEEDMTPVPAGETSIYGASRNTSSYMDNTPLPQDGDTSSVASTPPVMRRRGGDGAGGKGPLDDGKQLSLREQENVVNRIEKENFGLKLKIHFLEDALRKVGPNYNEAAIAENTELKVNREQMARELKVYKKHVTSAEKELESYRQQILELQAKAKAKYADENLRRESEALREQLQEKDADIEHLQRELEREQNDQDKVEKLQDEIEDLQADLRRKDDLITEREDELDEWREKAADAEEKLNNMQQRIEELEEKARDGDHLREAKDTIEDLEASVKRLERQAEELKQKLENAISEKERAISEKELAEANLEELQEDMADKSMVTKGLSRQVEEKISRLQIDLDKARQDYTSLEEQHASQRHEIEDLQTELRDAQRDRESSERMRLSLEQRLEQAQSELRSLSEEKAVLQTRHDALTNESASLQREVASVKKAVTQLEENLEREREHNLNIERDIRNQYDDEINRLNDEISDLQAECREKDNLYDNDSEKWDTERHNLESERDRAEERAAGLQRAMDKLREAEGALSDKETKLQEALQIETDRHKTEESILKRQIEDLQQSLDNRQSMLQDLRNELSDVRDQLRQAQLDCQTYRQKVEALEDEVELLQSTIDEESEKARFEMERAQRERNSLEQQIASLQAVADAARVSGNAAQEAAARQTSENMARLKFQLADATENLEKVTKERKNLMDRHTTLEGELRSLKSSLASTKAERDELEAEIGRLRLHQASAEDTFQFDKEKLDLRTAKAKLDPELRRLKEENKTLLDQRREVEQSLEQELEKAAAEEERLNEEIRNLHAQIRQQSAASGQPGQELMAARRTIRELERKIEDMETQQAATTQLQLEDAGHNHNNDVEVSILQRDLSAARKKEAELVARDATHKETIKTLKKQVADLERKAHEAELDRLLQSSPSSVGVGSAQKREIAELRHQLSTAHKSLHDLKKEMREAERKAAESQRELEERLEEMDLERVELQEALEEAQVQAEEEAAVLKEELIARYKGRVEKYKRERDEALATAAAASAKQQKGGRNMDDSNVSDLSVSFVEERRDLHAMLKESQLAADKLDREVREHREALEELLANETTLRKKLERARSERAAYRAGAEKLQKDVRRLKEERDRAVKEAGEAVLEAKEEIRKVEKERKKNEKALVLHAAQKQRETVDTDAIIRAAEAAERRHEKEIRGLVMQMEWMKACWDREAQLRKDAAFAKKYLLLEVQVRDAWYVLRFSFNPTRAVTNLISFSLQQQSRPGNHQQDPRRDCSLPGAVIRGHGSTQPAQPCPKVTINSRQEIFITAITAHVVTTPQVPLPAP